MDWWYQIKSFIWSWWKIDKNHDKNQDKIEKWGIHNEYLMKIFFPKFNKSGKATELLEDFEKILERIDSNDCAYVKAAQIKNVRKAVEILNEN